MTPDLVAVGAASRDLDPADARGWRLGGSVVYLGFAFAVLGVRAGLLVGVDPAAAEARELAALESLGVAVRRVPLKHGPVFDLVEDATGRHPRWLSRSDALPVERLPAEWAAAPAWALVPVAGELPDAWSAIAPASAVVALGWQGLLRDLAPGGEIRPIPPSRTPLTARADLAVVSREDVAAGTALSTLAGCVRRGGLVALTMGSAGGLVMRKGGDVLGDAKERGMSTRLCRYPAIASERVIDATGAGDTFLAGLVAGLGAVRVLTSDSAAYARALGPGLALGAALASLIVEGRGTEPFGDPVAAGAALGSRLAAQVAAR